MASKELNRLINRCITDKAFCELVLHKPAEAIIGYALTEGESTALLQTKTQSLAELVAALDREGVIDVGETPAQFPKRRDHPELGSHFMS